MGRMCCMNGGGGGGGEEHMFVIGGKARGKESAGKTKTLVGG
jgi:hypothetical protein